MEKPSFEELQGMIQSFLAENGWPKDIVWVDAEQVYVWRGRVFLRPVKRQSLAVKREYINKNDLPYGISADARAINRGKSFVSIWSPRTEVDAEYAMALSGIKISVPHNSLNPILVKSNFQWFFIRRFAWFSGLSRNFYRFS